MSLADRLRSLLPARVDSARVDATTVPTTYGGASVVNDLSGLGGDRDSGSTGRPNVSRYYLSEEELIAAFRGTIYRRLCELLPRWATTRGWTVTDDSADEHPLARELKRLGVKEAIRQADTLAQCMGEARILLVTDDSADLSEPIDFARTTKLHRLEVLDRREFSAAVYQGDMTQGEYGAPTHYDIYPQRTGATSFQRVHASRLLRFYGHDLPPSERSRNYASRSGWGADAIGQTLWDGIRNMAGTSAAGARLAQELSIAVFKLNPPSQASDQRAAFQAQMRAVNVMKSIANAVFITPDEDFSRVAASPSGFGDLSEDARLTLAGLTGYPLALLFGEAPSGLNTDGDSWQANWHAVVAAHQEERYRVPVETIVELLYYIEHGRVPDEWEVQFRPLGEMTEIERAQLRLTTTQADSMAIMEGVLTAAEARQRYMQPGGFAVELQPLEERPVSEPTPPSIDAADGAVWLGLPLPADALPAWRAARAAVEAVTGPLEDPGDGAHITLLWMGVLPPVAMDEVLTAALAVASRARPCEIRASAVRVFPEGDDGWPVVLDVSCWGLDGLHGELLARTAHIVTAKQPPRYVPHVTIGYSRTLTPEQRAAAVEVTMPEMEWRAGRLDVRRDGVTVATMPLEGREDGTRS